MTFGSAVPASWNFASALAGLQQGTAANNRIGNKIFLHSIQFTITMKPASVAAGTIAEQCRCVIYHNRETSGVLPVGANGMFTHAGLAAQRFQPLLNQYGVLRDGIHTFTPQIYNSTSSTVVLGPPVTYVWRVFPRRTVDFRSNAGTISDLYKDDYGVGCVAEVNGAASPSCEMRVRIQVIFSDA